ncbi:hypothetical protein CYMTET_49483 [Cymbomonas tetramitiformis]|uniref:Uncharacterized protein n=1 Tax=Cymbomonas tetramitiformis TaxID=36881 RepID=A0AAE0BRB6_9CHLO|nr:hypothetical protein CYMTET_49483 [Cymbomonas tetramitiformis]
MGLYGGELRACPSFESGVEEGQKLCEVGFCHEPYLHLQMHLTSSTSAPTLKFALRSGDSPEERYFPQAGSWYTMDGVVDPATT